MPLTQPLSHYTVDSKAIDFYLDMEAIGVYCFFGGGLDGTNKESIEKRTLVVIVAAINNVSWVKYGVMELSI